MGTFSVKNKSIRTQAEFKNDAMIVVVNFDKKDKGVLVSYTGQCFRLTDKGQQGEFFGNFNGFSRNDGKSIKYSMSEMSRQDADIVWDAIDEIEPHILNEEQAGEAAE